MKITIAVLAAAFGLLLSAQTSYQGTIPQPSPLKFGMGDSGMTLWGGGDGEASGRMSFSTLITDTKTGKTKGISVQRQKDGSILLKDETGAVLATIWKDGYVTGDAAEALRRLAGFTENAE